MMKKVFSRSSELVYHVTSLVCKLLSFSTTTPFMADDNGCEREGKLVCQSGSSVCVFVGSGNLRAAEFTKQKKGSPQLELY